MRGYITATAENFQACAEQRDRKPSSPFSIHSGGTTEFTALSCQDEAHVEKTSKLPIILNLPFTCIPLGLVGWFL